MLMTTMERLAAAAPGAEMIVVLSHDMEPVWRDMCAEHSFSLPHRIVYGGPTRAHSVKNALMTLDAATAGWISVHDAARPMVTAAMMSRLLDAIGQGAVAVVPAVAVTDSLRLLGADGRSQAVDRSLYRAVQTPQVFDGPALIRANDRDLLPTFTDDASVMEAAGHQVAIVEGEPANIKVTNPGDIARIESLSCPAI